ncbi:ABC transporter substrate-binding protein [Microvirga rosea]|uniref:ABC transporter substrate-binding protein n=1 Tax=Microvirga rosea TaxID=2715425 RepID=UPI001D0AA995|nr:ABC transporter substrate-binding protein [Microvirga rosea]MCB8822050.1 ABC transporter substrate-binding protein [Microvirga rosea]
MLRRGRGWAAALLGLSLTMAPGALMAKDKLTVDLVNEPSSLDPQVQWNPDSYYVYRNIFDNLVTRDDKGEIIPQIATAWKQTSETEVEFTIREDVTFHDGQKLKADDVVFSVQRITDPKFASPQLGQFNKIVKAEATSPTTVKLTTDGPYPALLSQLVKLSIVPKHVVEAVGKDAFNLKPVGSGPYKFDSWQRGVQVTLSAYDRYWGPKGPFATAVFRAVPDAATRVANLQAGTSDLAVTLDSDLAAQLKSSPKAKVLSVLTERVAYLRLNPAKPPFDNIKVRQAVAYAIDKGAMVDGILGGYDQPVPEMLTPAHEGWVADIAAPSYDLTKAQALVKEAGEGGKAEIELATSPVFDQRIVQAIQQMLTEAGLNVKINMSDMASYLKRAQGGIDATPALSFGRWSCSCQDADGVLFPLLHKSSSWSVYRNPKADELLEKARQSLDEKVRLEAYRGVHEIVAQDVPLVPLYQSAAIYGAAKGLQWQPSPSESMFLNRMAWKD